MYGASFLASVVALSSPAAGEPRLPQAKHVYGATPDTVTLIRAEGGRAERVATKDLSTHAIEPGRYTMVWTARGEGFDVPPCNVRERLLLDGNEVKGAWSVTPPAPAEPIVAAMSPDKDHEFRLELRVSDYERRVACGYAPRAGLIQDTREELRVLSFESNRSGKCRGACAPGRAVVFIPRAHDEKKPSALLVGVHPWNGNAWTYAAYTELLHQAQERDVVLLFPSGLGNSLYTADAEAEVIDALDALTAVIAIDPRRVSIFGASMGGQGATTIGFHRPDRFATVTSFFGDAKFDVKGYVRGILPTEEAAHRVNPLDVLENARHTPLWLIHGTLDKTSPIEQSEILFAAMSERGYKVKFDKDPKWGHNGALVAKHAVALVDLAASARAPAHPARVSFKSVRAEDVSAYGIRLVRERPGDALFDVEYVPGKIRLLAASNVKELVLTHGVFGLAPDQEPPLVPVGPLAPVAVTWK